jgi:ATP-dependent Lhr-like helicase
VTVSTDLIYDVLRRHEPDTSCCARRAPTRRAGLLDLERLAIRHKRLARFSPLSAPILLEIGREPIYGQAQETSLAEAADALIGELIAE